MVFIKYPKRDIKYSLHLIIQDLEEKLRSLELSNYILSKNTKDRSKQLLALAYILCLYELYRLHILD